jgi:hypothetical protein
VDVLIVVGDVPAPERLAARARRVVAIEAGGVGSDTVASLRAHIPRSVGVVGDAAVARALHRAGLPVILYTDEADIPGGVDDGIDVEPLTDPGPAMEVAGSLLDLIGGTPLVRLDRVGRDLSCHLMAKLEYLNPGGSVKDRPALRMIEAAESEGLLAPGGTIVEPTSGNTGVGLAIVAARRGYKCIFTMPDKIASEKMQLLRAYGAEVVVCPTSVAPDHPESYYSVARRLVAPISRTNTLIPTIPRPMSCPPARKSGDRLRGVSRTWWPASARGGPFPVSVVTSRRRTRPYRSSAPTPKARSIRGVVGGLTWWRASGRISGPKPTTRAWWTGW